MIIKPLLSPIKILGWALVGDYKFVWCVDWVQECTEEIKKLEIYRAATLWVNDQCIISK